MSKNKNCHRKSAEKEQEKQNNKNKEEKEVNVNTNEELKNEEVNGLCKCGTQSKMHCNHDCINGTSWITTSN